MHSFPDISISKGNQKLKFGQLIEYNKRNLSFDGKTSPRPFFKISNLRISLYQESEFLYSLLLLYILAEDYRNILKLRW